MKRDGAVLAALVLVVEPTWTRRRSEGNLLAQSVISM